MTPKQERILHLLRTFINADQSATVSIHDLEYPVTPDSINPALADLATLQALGEIGEFERISSRVVKVTNITTITYGE